MIDKQEISQKILSDVVNSVPLSDILTKAKIYAELEKDQQFSEWLHCEILGYNDNLPDYRKLECSVNVDIHQGFGMVNNFPYPIDIIKNDDIRERMSKMGVYNTIGEIENWLKQNEDQEIKKEIPVRVWNIMDKHINGTIQGAWQLSPVSQLNKIIVSVKYILTEYFIKIAGKENFDFATMITTDTVKPSYGKINANIVNIGNSNNITTSENTNIVGDNNTISPQNIDKLKRIIDDLCNITEINSNEECKEITADMKREISKTSPSHNFLKRCFQALGSFIKDVAVNTAAEEITGLINAALTLL